MSDRRDFLKELALCGLSLPLLSANRSSASAVAGNKPDGSRHRINLGDTPWRFIKADPYPDASKADFNDAGWEQVGVPHCFNDMDTYQNISLNKAFRGTVWYRKHFTVAPECKGKRVFLEFQGVTLAAAVYVNGKFKRGNLPVAQPQDTTHVGSFLPFVLDITDDVQCGKENVLAVRVSNAENSFFTWPGFGAFLGLGMGFGGIVAPVYLHVTNDIYIPSNSYSPMEQWGTYTATVAASDDKARIMAHTNVVNSSTSAKTVQLTTRLIDAKGMTVLTMRDSQTIAPGTGHVFKQAGDLQNPKLWYPNNSPYGTPALYTVSSEVSEEGGKLIDAIEEPFGIRTMTWDADYGYVNGKKHLLQGFGQRNTYPALGSAVPAELQWNDVRLIAECGGTALRIGHFPATVETVAACDAYGIMVIQDSGDDEWALHDKTANAYKKTYDRDCIIQFRNHAAITAWESNNGIASTQKHENIYSPAETQSLVDSWDPAGGRIVETRDTSDFWPKDKRIMIGYTASFKKVAGSPSMNMECYTRGSSRFDYKHEKEYADVFVKQYLSNIRDKACGWILWMLAETMETPFMPFLDGRVDQKSLGSCAMDGNRFPKLTYTVFEKAIWAPYPERPGVALQSSWNLTGVQSVDAWSNCPRVELFVNGKSQGVRTPNEERRFTWEKVTWQSGTLRAVGMDAAGTAKCSDEQRTAGAPHRIELSAGPKLVRPDGKRFEVFANGSNVALITARVVDKAGVVCPDFNEALRFSISGPGDYRGSYNFYVDPSKPATYHSPGDLEMQAEGGLMRVAVRSTFTPGRVTVQANSGALEPGKTAFSTVRPR